MKNIKKAQEKFEKQYGNAPKTQILANEQCRPHCPVRNEHYGINFQGDHYFGNKLSSFSCRKWENEDKAYDYKRAVPSPFREDIEELLSYIDIFKLFGRDGRTMLKLSFELISSYVNQNDILPTFTNAYKINNQELDEFKEWRSKIKNCNFQCWDCNTCDDLAQKLDRLRI